jgi:hypothetical protein
MKQSGSCRARPALPLVLADQLQLVVADRFEAQPDQIQATDPTNPHDADKGFDRPTKIRGIDTTKTDLATRLGPKMRSSINTPTPETEISAAGKRSVFRPC